MVLGYGLDAGGRYIKEYSGGPVVARRVGPARQASLGLVLVGRELEHLLTSLFCVGEF